MCSADLTTTTVSSHGVTGDVLPVKGEQTVLLAVNGHQYRHQFCVCSLATEADAILGTDFLNLFKAKVDLEEQNLWLMRSKGFKCALSEQGTSETQGLAIRAALTPRPAPNRSDKKNRNLTTRQNKEQVKQPESKKFSSQVTLKEAEPWLVQTTSTITIPPRVKKLIVGRVNYPKHGTAPDLVCVEPAQVPFEGVLIARGLSPVLTAEGRSGETRETTRCWRTNQLATARRAELVYVQLVNFSQDEVILPKATVVGVAEEVSPSLVAAINDDSSPTDPPGDQARFHVNTVKDETKFRKYADSVLGHLSKHERAVMEPVLRKYLHVFHLDENRFQGTDLVEHRIIRHPTEYLSP